MNLLAQSPRVFLVGAGPGNPDWLTVKAHRLLQEADVVLHDALVSDAILSLISPKSIVIDIGKRRGYKLLTQDEINALLVPCPRPHHPEAAGRLFLEYHAALSRAGV